MDHSFLSQRVSAILWGLWDGGVTRLQASVFVVKV